MRRFNINFKQTAKAFKAARQTQVFSRINRNLPYNIFVTSKDQFIKGAQKLKFIYKNPLKNKSFQAKKTSYKR